MSTPVEDSAAQLSPAEFSTTIERLQRRIHELEQHNQDLQWMVETSAAHGDIITENLVGERDDLIAMMEMAADHADVVEDELFERVATTLRKSEQQLRQIVEATPTPVFIFRQDTDDIVYANGMMGTLFSVDSTSLLGRSASELFLHSDEHKQLMRLFTEHESVDCHEIRLKDPQGEALWTEISLRPLEFNEQSAVLCGIHDIRHLKAMNQAASRFVPKEYMAFLNKKDLTEVALGDHVSGEMTVMFSDLRDFTQVSEGMTPHDNFAFINAYLGRVSPLIREHQGFIIKYLGDGMHAVFPHSAEDGVRAGIAKLQQVADYNAHRSAKGRQPIHIGIGLNTGYMMVGIVGDQERIQGDAFSDAVNLTARIEGLTKFYSANLIISETTLAQLPEPERYAIRFLDKVQVAGRRQSLNLYEVYDADPEPQRVLKQETQDDYEAALALYYQREFEASQAKLFSVLQRNPRDKLAWHHLVNATKLIEVGVPDGWSGVMVMDKK